MAKYAIVSVESIPCELVGQQIEFNDRGMRISDPLDTKWPMPWVEIVISEFSKSDDILSDGKTTRLYNPEEPDQYVEIESL